VASSGSNKSLLLASTIVLVQILAVLVFIPSEWIARAQRLEITWLELVHREATVIWIAEKTYALYAALVIDTGVVDGLRWMFLPEQYGSREPGTGIEQVGMGFWFPYLEGRGQALADITHLILFRLVGLAIWAPLFVIVLFPSLVDGFMERLIKQHGFRYPSPLAHRLGLRMSMAVGFIIIVTLLLPLPIPPLVLPTLVAVVIAVFGVLVIGNLPKKL
jgi:hypothetical protein